MYKNKSFIALILARGGSKGVPNKNIRLLEGKPLIAYSIEALLGTKIYDRIIVSTDSNEIAAIAKQYGAEAPFMRPSDIAQDRSSAFEAIDHAMQWIKKNDKTYDYVQYVMPTAPLRTSEDCKKAIDLLLETKVEMVISVCETEHPLSWMNTLPEDLSMKDFVPQKYRAGLRQAAAKSYRLNGAIYVGAWDVFFNKKDWYEVTSKAYIMPQERSVDIDSMMDFNYVEYLMRKK